MADTDDEIKKLTDIRTLILTSIVTALSFVVALFWRDAITGTIEQIVPTGESLFLKYMTAIIVTCIVVFVAFVLIRSQRLAEERISKIIGKEKAKAGGKKKKGLWW